VSSFRCEPIDEPLGVFAIEQVSTMPTSIVLDQSFVVGALESSAPGHDAAAGFLERMVHSGTTMFFNDLLELQLQDAAFDLAQREVHAAGMRSKDQVSILARALLGRWQKLIESSEAVYVELPPLLEDSMYYQERFGLPAADSLHAAMVMASDADGIATIDQAFGAVDPSLLPVFTPAQFVRGTRARRRSYGRSVT